MMTAKQRECHEQFAKDRVKAIKKGLDEERVEIDEEQFMLEQAGTAVDYT